MVIDLMDGTTVRFPCNSREHALMEMQAISIIDHDWTRIGIDHD